MAISRYSPLKTWCGVKPAAQLLKFRHMQTNAIRGLLLEFGHPLPESYLALRKACPTVMATLDKQLPGILIETLREQWAWVQSLDNEIALIEGRLKRALAETPTCQMISDIPGVGLMTATAAVATMGNPVSFKTDFAWKRRFFSKDLLAGRPKYRS